MPRRRPCPEGSGCKYQHHYQHTLEFSHGEESEKVAAKAAERKASAWRKTQGRALGGSRKRSLPHDGSTIKATTSRKSRASSRNAILAAGEAAAKRFEKQETAKQGTQISDTRPRPSKAVSAKRTNSDSHSQSRNGKTKRGELTSRIHENKAKIFRSQTSWTCARCTVVNETVSSCCSACNSRRQISRDNQGQSRECAINLASDSDSD